jgi:hypothetical protein
MTAVPAWAIDELANVLSVKAQPPPRPMRERLLQEVACGMELAMPLDQLPDMPVVFIDKKARVAAYAWPHAEQFTMLERTLDGLVRAHMVQGPIVRQGMWSLCALVAEVNSGNAWGSTLEDGSVMSVARMLQSMLDFERRTCL